MLIKINRNLKLRCLSKSGNITTNLIASKSRVTYDDTPITNVRESAFSPINVKR